MSYKALYRSYRPQTFDEVAGQEHVVTTLKNAIKENRIAHAYLFAGPRGTGKTTVAKLLAKALNCTGDNPPCDNCPNCKAITASQHPDVIEIDAASNNGVDEVRDLIDKVKYAPINGKYKVYIIDEVHMMSQGAFNALLKTLEEPPAHVVFILATTELQKVPATIISRTQRYNFKRISKSDLEKRMQYILQQENIKYDEKALSVIAQVADGGMRDALSILDQLLSYEKESVNYDDALKVTGFAARENIEKILLSLLNLDAESALKFSRQSLSEGASSKNILDELIDLTTNSLMINKAGDQENDSNFLTDEFAEKVKEFSPARFFKLITLANDALNDLRYTNQQQIPLEVFLVRASQNEEKKTAQTVSKNISVATPAANNNDLQAEIAALKKQVVELTQKVGKISQPTASFDKDHVFHIDNSGSSSNAKVKETKEKKQVKKVKPVKKLSKNNDQNKKQVYHVLENATREDLNKVKEVWPDLQSVLEVSERALLDVLKPVAASPDQIVMKCKYTLWFEKASSDSDLMAKLTGYIEKFTKHSYDIVLVPDNDWLDVRQEFVQSHRQELLAKKKKEIQAVQEEKSQEADNPEVVNKAKDLFGDLVRVKD